MTKVVEWSCHAPRTTHHAHTQHARRDGSTVSWSARCEPKSTRNRRASRSGLFSLETSTGASSLRPLQDSFRRPIRVHMKETISSSARNYSISYTTPATSNAEAHARTAPFAPFATMHRPRILAHIVFRETFQIVLLLARLNPASAGLGNQPPFFAAELSSQLQKELVNSWLCNGVEFMGCVPSDMKPLVML